MEISDDKYKWLKRFWIVEYTNNEKEDLEYDIVNALKSNHIKILSTTEASEFLDTNTTLTKISDWVYELHPEHTDDLSGEAVVQKTISIV